MMQFHELNSVQATNIDGSYIVMVDITDMDGIRGAMQFSVNPTDQFGLGPTVRAAVEQWIAEGKEIIPYTPPTEDEIRAAMPSLTRRQFRLGMMSLGITSTSITDHIETIADPTEREVAMIEWEDATQFERTHPLVVNLSAAMNIDPATLDATWMEYVSV